MDLNVNQKYPSKKAVDNNLDSSQIITNQEKINNSVFEQDKREVEYFNRSIKCQKCGGNNILVEVGQLCDYCGSILTNN